MCFKKLNIRDPDLYALIKGKEHHAFDKGTKKNVESLQKISFRHYSLVWGRFIPKNYGLLFFIKHEFVNFKDFRVYLAVFGVEIERVLDQKDNTSIGLNVENHNMLSLEVMNSGLEFELNMCGMISCTI